MSELTNVDISGNGKPLLLLHGWPFHKASYRKLIPLLSDQYCCHALNSRGMDERPLTPSDDMSFAGHAARTAEYIRAQGWEKVTILAHDTAGTFARLLALAEPHLVERLILLNTEIPQHRPPFIPLYQSLSRMPFYKTFFQWQMRSKRFQKSASGFGGCFYNKGLIDDEFIALFGSYWFETEERYRGLIAYLQGVNFDVVDELEEIHQKLKTPVHFIWGENDATFPMVLGKAMSKRMPSCESFDVVPETCFLPHEEQPDIVAKFIHRILGNG